jgi:ABC-type uncharacterized transport system ATPase subunit
VSIEVPAGSFHALLGENGAGKSTLVKCIMGFYKPDRGQLLIDGREATVRSPRGAQGLGVGMVYQHFTLVPALTAAEDLVVSRADAPAVIDWRKERKSLEAFLDAITFRVPLKKPVSAMAAGEKQKLEILKLLYLNQRFLILDVPAARAVRRREAHAATRLGRKLTDLLPALVVDCPKPKQGRFAQGLGPYL